MMAEGDNKSVNMLVSICAFYFLTSDPSIQVILIWWVCFEEQR